MHLFCPPATHLAPGAVRAEAEGLAHSACGTAQHEGVTPHIPRHQYRLAHRVVTLGQLRIPGAEGAGSSLAMHQHFAPAVPLKLCVVVCKIIENTQTMIFRPEPSQPKSPPGKVRDALAVCESEVGNPRHSCEVSLTLRALSIGAAASCRSTGSMLF